MSDSPNAALPNVLEALLQAEADFARMLREAAPLPAGSTKDPKHLYLMSRYERYVPSDEVTAIARLLYMLDAYGVDDGEALGKLITLHNERMVELAGDTDYLARMHAQKSKFLQAQFSGPAEHNAVGDFRDNDGIALNATNMGRLLVQFAGRTQIDEAMELLTSLGLLERVKDEGHYNSNVRLSTGRLEALYRGYLAQVARGVADALGDAGKAKLTEVPGNAGGDNG